MTVMGKRMGCYVYMIQSGEHIKIGHSKDPENRLSQMQTGSPYTLKLVAMLPFETKKAAHEYEKDLHFRLKLSHFRGEWFHKNCMKNAMSLPCYAGAKKKNPPSGRDARWVDVRQ